jgi:SAM-dependent methyltransferase
VERKHSTPAAGPGRAQDGIRYYKRDFWGKENLKYSRPHFRMGKVARQVRKHAGDREVTLLDLGCGPATLATLLPPTVRYYGIDIAIQEPAPNLIEADLVEQPIAFKGMAFDIIVAQGVFEYMGDVQSLKLAEIADILNPGGKFICTYQNFDHRQRNIYWPYSNIQPPADFRADLHRHFNIQQAFPTGYNWKQSHPNRTLIRAPQEHLNINIPVIGKKLAIDYCYLCTHLAPLAEGGLRTAR